MPNAGNLEEILQNGFTLKSFQYHFVQNFLYCRRFTMGLLVSATVAHLSRNSENVGSNPDTGRYIVARITT